jgi:predicted ArsR family transcriptional regulator
MSTLGLLVEKIHSGGTMEVSALAAELGTSPAMIEAMLEHLQRQGIVRRCGQSSEACSACGLGATCAIEPGRAIRVWQSVHQRATTFGE